MISTDTTAQRPALRAATPEQRAYLMVKPPEAEALAIDRMCRAHGLDRRYDWTRLHLTLVPLGDFRMLSIDELDRIAEAAAALSTEPFEIVLHRIRGNALVGRDTGPLRRFQRALVARLAACGALLPDYRFLPHVSLVYGERTSRNIPIDPIRWTVAQFQLVNSVHGKGHETIGRWALRRRQGDFGF